MQWPVMERLSVWQSQNMWRMLGYIQGTLLVSHHLNISLLLSPFDYYLQQEVDVDAVACDGEAVCYMGRMLWVYSGDATIVTSPQDLIVFVSL